MKSFRLWSAVLCAATLGLDYPEVHGIAHHGMHAATVPLRLQSYNGDDHEVAVAEPIMVSSTQNQPGVTSQGERKHKQDQARGSESSFLLSHGTYNPVQSPYTADQVLRLPRGQVINRKPKFEAVKHVGPSVLTEAPGPSDLVSWDFQGCSKPLSFVHSEHDLVVDESVPNRHGISLNGLPLPWSWGHSTYQGGLTGYGLGRRVPVLSSSGFIHKDRIRTMMSRG